MIKDIRTKYKRSGHDYHPRRHWLRRWQRDLEKFTEARVTAIEARWPRYEDCPEYVAHLHAELISSLL